MHGVGEQVGLVQRQGATFKLVGQACGVVEEFWQIADLAAGFADQLAVVTAFQLGQVFLVLGNQVTQATQQLATRGGGDAAPFLAFEGTLGGLHGQLDVGFVSVGKLCPGLGGGRV